MDHRHVFHNFIPRQAYPEELGYCRYNDQLASILYTHDSHGSSPGPFYSMYAPTDYQSLAYE